MYPVLAAAVFLWLWSKQPISLGGPPGKITRPRMPPPRPAGGASRPVLPKGPSASSANSYQPPPASAASPSAAATPAGGGGGGGSAAAPAASAEDAPAEAEVDPEEMQETLDALLEETDGDEDAALALLDAAGDAPSSD